MLRFQSEYLTVTQKTNFDICTRKLLKDYIEKAILLNFINLYLIVCSISPEETRSHLQ